MRHVLSLRYSIETINLNPFGCLIEGVYFMFIVKFATQRVLLKFDGILVLDYEND